MGCAPSIHVSQSGVFYCRDEIREGSSPRPRASSPSEIVGHIRTSSDSGSHISTSSSSRNRGSNKKAQNSHRGSSIEAETQTYDPRSMESPKVKRLLFSRLRLWPTCLRLKGVQWTFSAKFVSCDLRNKLIFFCPTIFYRMREKKFYLDPWSYFKRRCR